MKFIFSFLLIAAGFISSVNVCDAQNLNNSVGMRNRVNHSKNSPEIIAIDSLMPNQPESKVKMKTGKELQPDDFSNTMEGDSAAVPSKDVIIINDKKSFVPK